MEITIDLFNPASIQKALAILEGYKQSLTTKQTELIENAVRKSADAANQVYVHHPGDHGIASAFYSVENGADGVTGTVTATAPAGEIGFIEFGTGIHHPEWDSSQVPYTPPEHGSYGKGQGRDPGWWYYNNWPTDGRDPASAMLVARQTMIDSVLDDAREVFRT